MVTSALPPPSPLPPPPPPPLYAPLVPTQFYGSPRRRLFWVRFALGTSAIAAGLAASTGARALMLPRWSEGDGRRMAETALGVGVVAALCWMGAVVAIAVWCGRVYRNLFALRIGELRFTPGWGVGSWFVPVLNLFRPKQIVDDIWRVTDPSRPLGAPWTSRRVPGLLHAWWALMLTSLFLAPWGGYDEEQLVDRALIGFGIVVAGVLVVAAGFAWHVTSTLTARLESFAGLRARATGDSRLPPTPAQRWWARRGALIVGACALIGSAAGVVVGFAVVPATSATGAVAEGVEAPTSADGVPTMVMELDVGDCLNELTPAGDGTKDVIGANVVPCDVPHSMELFGVVVHDAEPGAVFPGEAALIVYGDRCLDDFERIVGVSYEQSALEVRTFVPNADGWRFGDRTIQCLASRMDGADLDRSVVGSGL